MAGLSLGAESSTPHASGDAPVRLRVPASSRTRRMHGVFALGKELATVYSTRREGDGFGVVLTVGDHEPGSLAFTCRMTTTQARAVAGALEAAATAAASPSFHSARGVSLRMEGDAA